GVDALREPVERGDGLSGDVAVLRHHKCPQRAAQLRCVRGQLFEPVKGLVQRRQPRSTVGHHRQRVQQTHCVADGPYRICALRGARLVSRRSFSALSTGLFACACTPMAVMLSDACRTSVRLVAMGSFTRPTPASTTPTPVSMRPNPFSATSVALRSTYHAPKMPKRLRPMKSPPRAISARRIVFSRIGMLGSDVLFRSRALLLPNETWVGLPGPFSGKISHNPLGLAWTEGKKPVAWRRVYVPWFPPAISKSWKRSPATYSL